MKYHRIKFTFGLLIWLVALSVGFKGLFDFSGTPGIASSLNSGWPASSKLKVPPNSDLLVLFLHPRCACSRATLAELESLLPALKGRVKVSIVFFRPKGKDEAWIKGTIWKQATSLTDVEVTIDRDEFESNAFHAVTSGQAYYFDAAGVMRFSGGITPARGHVGENDGVRAIQTLASQRSAEITQTPVYGCSFQNPTRVLAGESL
jgi:hypothetical protein